MSVLICEDLARPDPVGDVIQLSVRISSLLFSATAPRSQVAGRDATRASRGRSRILGSDSHKSRHVKAFPPGRPSKDRSGVVALWRDAKTGTTEISLPDKYDAIVLNITVEYHEEWTADGRGDGKNSGYPVLSGYHLIDGTEGSTENDDGSQS